MKVLIIGGAGFIGSHTADELHKKGYEIIIFDNLSPKTHSNKWPDYLHPSYKKIKGDVRNATDLFSAMKGVDYIIHLAALMDLMPDYSDFFDTNVTSTARIYELIVKEHLPIKKVIVASSQFVYGEGRWKCQKDGIIFPHPRSSKQLEKKIWELSCPHCHGHIEMVPNEEVNQDPPNQYAISKYTQELIALKLGKLNNIPSVAMRYSIVHGPRQSIKNAYSGALRIFALQLLNNEKPTIYEDGFSLRDYVSVYDVARANVRVLEDKRADFQNYNVGGGKAYSVLELARIIANKMQYKGVLTPNEKFRLGDIRHAVSSIEKLKKLGWNPIYEEEQVIDDYITWLRTQSIDLKQIYKAQDELTKLGIVRG